MESRRKENRQRKKEWEGLGESPGGQDTMMLSRGCRPQPQWALKPVVSLKEELRKGSTSNDGKSEVPRGLGLSVTWPYCLHLWRSQLDCWSSDRSHKSQDEKLHILSILFDLASLTSVTTALARRKAKAQPVCLVTVHGQSSTMF
ncbi:hypothetical protein GN956_G1892 [Arapaima gigas]